MASELDLWMMLKKARGEINGGARIAGRCLTV